MKGPSIILVPTDFSTSAARALEHAIALATRLVGSTIYLLHAYQLPIVGLPDGTAVPTAAIATQLLVEAERQLAACVAVHQASGVAIVPMLRQADPRAAVLAAIEELSADLVVMGTHGRRGVTRLLVGSVAESVMRASPVPVMTVHAAPA